MFGFMGAKASLTTLYTLASLITCKIPPEPSVDIILNMSAKPVILQAPSKSITATCLSEAVCTNAMPKKTIDGLTFSVIDIKADFEIKNRMDRRTFANCLDIQRAVVTINYTPRVTISSDYKNTSVNYSSLMKHHKKHIDLDKRLLEAAIPGWTRDLKKAVVGTQNKEREPIAQTRLEEYKKKIVADIIAKAHIYDAAFKEKLIQEHLKISRETGVYYNQ